MRRLGPPNTRRSPEWRWTSMNGDVRRSTPAMRNKQASPMLIVTTAAGGWSECVGDGSTTQLGDSWRHRFDRGTIGVVGSAAVGVRLPVPAEADGLDTHEVSAWHTGVTQTCRRQGPLSELVDQSSLLDRCEPAGEQDDSWRDVTTLALTSVQ